MSAFKTRRIVIATVTFAVTVVAVSLAASRLSHRYIASAFLMGSVDANATGDSAARLTSAARQLLTDQTLGEIDTRLHPYTALASALFPQWTVARLRSELSIDGTYASLGAVRVFYSGPDRKTVVGVTQAVAETLSRPKEKDATPAVARAASATPVHSPVMEKSGATPDPAALLSQRAALQAAADDREQSGKTLQSRLDKLTALEAAKGRLDGLEPPSVAAAPPVPQEPVAGPDPQRAILQAVLNGAVKDLAALRERYTDEYPDVVAARERVEQLRSDLAGAAEPTAVSSPPVFQPPTSGRAQIQTGRVQTPDAQTRGVEASQKRAAIDRQETEIKVEIAGLEQKLFESQARIARLQATPPIAPSVASPDPIAPTATPDERPRETLPPQFTVLKKAAIRSSEQTLSPAAIAAMSISSGLALALTADLLVRAFIRRKEQLTRDAVHSGAGAVTA